MRTRLHSTHAAYATPQVPAPCCLPRCISLCHLLQPRRTLSTSLAPKALSRRGCHRAALECCKLLLALEPEDPLGALYLVDYLAVRAGRCGGGDDDGLCKYIDDEVPFSCEVV